jgi:hypothetical protein
MWSGAALVLLLAVAIALTRLHQAGSFSLPALEGLYAWVAAHV